MVVKKKPKKPASKEKRVKEFTNCVHTTVEELCKEFQDLGVTVEIDFRGYTTSVTVRVHKDRAGGLLKTHRYNRPVRS